MCKRKTLTWAMEEREHCDTELCDSTEPLGFSQNPCISPSQAGPVVALLELPRDNQSASQPSWTTGL